MTAAVPFPLPPGRVLSTWRRELAAFRPGRLRLAHLLLHRVEALVRVAHRRALDPFQAALLGQVAAAAPPDRLRLDRELLDRWLHDLAAGGLIETAGEGQRLTDAGRRALDSGAWTAVTEERRSFLFMEEEEPNTLPTFLPLHGPAVALEPPPGWRFDPAALEACVGRPPEWKERHGFPADVEAVVAPPGPHAGPADWRRVIFDRPEQILLVFVPAEGAPPRMLGFAVRPEGWALQPSAPALVLPVEDGRAEALPRLAGEPSPEAWREAWRGWAEARGLPDAGGCRVEPLEDRVRVSVPRAPADRNDAWLAAGTGRVRVAAPMEIVEGG